MKRFFGTDSPLFRFMTILLELAEINLLFILCSLPVVTLLCSQIFLQEAHVNQTDSKYNNKDQNGKC